MKWFLFVCFVFTMLLCITADPADAGVICRDGKCTAAVAVEAIVTAPVVVTRTVVKAVVRVRDAKPVAKIVKAVKQRERKPVVAVLKAGKATVLKLPVVRRLSKD